MIKLTYTKVAALRKLAYGGDMGDGSYYDRTYIPLPGLDEWDPELNKAYNNADAIIKELDSWLPMYKRHLKSFAKDPDNSVMVSQHAYNVNDNGDVDEIPLSEWVARYNAAKKAKDPKALRDIGSYAFYRYAEPRKKFLGIF